MKYKQQLGYNPQLDYQHRIFERSAGFYTANLATWQKAAAALNGGRAYITATLKRHPSETVEEYSERIGNSYNINLIKYSTRRFGDYIFSKPPRREGSNKDVVFDFDRKRSHVNVVMREIFDYHTIFSLVWVFVDMPELQEDFIDLKTKKDGNIRPYARAVPPMAVPDWSFGETGELEWVVLEEYVTKKSNPKIEPELWQRRTLYTKDYWQKFERKLYDEGFKGQDMGIIEYDPVPNKLGKVPVIPYTSMLPEGLITVPPIDDLLTIHDAVLAGESELLTNILKQTYGQLVLPASSSVIVNRIKAKLVDADSTIDLSSSDVEAIISREVNTVLSRTKAIMEGEEEKQTARYIQPAGATIDSIITHDDRLMSVMMRLYGFLMGVHTTQRESAESKSVDNISLASQLASIASGLEDLETRLWQMMNEYDGSIGEPKVTYNTNFDIHELNAIVAGIAELVNLDCGKEYARQLKRTAVNVLNSIHHISDENFEKIYSEIDRDVEGGKPIKFEEHADHASDASGSRPDSIKATTDYQKDNKSKMKKSDAI